MDKLIKITWAFLKEIGRRRAHRHMVRYNLYKRA